MKLQRDRVEGYNKTCVGKGVVRPAAMRTERLPNTAAAPAHDPRPNPHHEGTLHMNHSIVLRLQVAGLACLSAVTASAQQADEGVEKVAAQLANPLAPVTSLAAQFRTEFGNGPNDNSNFTLRLQPSFFKPLPGGSAVLLRSILPIRGLRWPDRVDGLGDLTLVPYYVPDLTSKVFVGYGASLGIPTATNDLLGSGKWTAGPAIIAAVTGQPLTWGGARPARVFRGGAGR